MKAPPRYWIGLAPSPRMSTARSTLLAGSKVLRIAARDGPTNLRPRMKVSTGMVVPITTNPDSTANRDGVQFTASWLVAAANPLHTTAGGVAGEAAPERGGIPGSSRLP